MNNKDLSFMKDTPFFHAGIYDNKKVFEHTTKAIENVIKSKVGLKIDLKMTNDGQIICFQDDNVKRLVHIDDKVSDIEYDYLNYLTKFPILKFSDLLKLTKDIPLIVEMDRNILEYKLKIMDELVMYEGKVAIVSKDMDTLKWLNKNYPKFIIGYKIDKDNMHRFHIFRRYDFEDIDINLYNDKYIRKQREEKFIIGHNVKDDNVYDLKRLVYDTLICESQLDN